MAMGNENGIRQPQMWVAVTDLPTAVSHPFYRRLNQLLREPGFVRDESRRVTNVVLSHSCTGTNRHDRPA
jgi:hypothetical protein